jgi:hypothetical protein
MKVGFKVESENGFKSISVPDISMSPTLVSIAQQKDNNMDNKFLVWHIEGGLGKNVAATALLPALAKQYKTRKTKRQIRLMKKTISNRYSKSRKNYNGLL